MPARILLLIFLCACSDPMPGRKLASGIAQRLTVAPGAVAFLIDAGHPDDRSVPDDLLAGDLWLGALESGAAQKIASGVSSAPGSFGFSARGEEVAVLASWRFRSGAGELWTAAPGQAAQQLAKEASSFAWSPTEPALAFVAPGRLGIRKAGGHEAVSVAIDGLHDVAWSPDGRHVAARAAASAGGKLWLVDASSGAKSEIAPGTSDFAFAPDGALAALGPPPPKGGDRPLLLGGHELARATAFAFSPDGQRLALLSTAKQPGEATGELSLLPRAGGEAKPVGQKAGDWRFGPSGELFFLGRYDLRARAGTLTVVSPGGVAREIAPKVQGFVAEKERVLYLVQAPQKGDFKIELWEAALSGASAPRKIDEGVYGWQLTPDGRTLLYKARCAGGPRSCSALRLALGTPDAKPEFLAANVAGFDLSQDGARLLLQQPHRGATRAVDLSVISVQGPPPQKIRPLVEEVDASSRFADPAGRRVVYAVIAASKGGVYVADVP